MSKFIAQYNFSLDDVQPTIQNSSKQFEAPLFNKIIGKTDAKILSNVNNLGLDKKGPTSELKSIELNASNKSYILLNPLTSTDGGLSIALWVVCYTNSTWARVFDFGNGPDDNNIIIFIKDNDFGISVKHTSKNNVILYGAVPKVTTGSGSNYSGVWFHIVWTMDPKGEWKVYINGELYKTFNKGILYPNVVSRKNMYIGRSNWSADPYFNGSIADFRIYNSVLTQNDVTNIFKLPTPKPDFDTDINWKWTWSESNGIFTQLKKNNKLVKQWSDMGITDNTDMSISFIVNISKLDSNWRNIVHVTNDGNNCCNPGQRIPGIWIWPNETRLHFRTGTKSNGNDGLDTDPLSLNTDIYVSITISKNKVKIYFDGVLNKSIQRSEPFTKANSTATVYCADPWHSVDGFKIKNLKFTNGDIYKIIDTTSVYDSAQRAWIFGGSDGKWYTLKKGGYSNEWSNLKIDSVSDMTISFMINIDKLPNDWRSIFHVSNSGDDYCSACRIPGIFLSPNDAKLCIGISTTSNNLQEVFYSNSKLPINKDVKVDFIITKRKCILLIDGKSDIIYTLAGDVISALPDATVYICDPFYEMPQTIKIKDFKVINGSILTPPETIGDFKKIGCYRDKESSRAIPNSRGKVKSLEECYKIAVSPEIGASVFGVQNNGDCYTGKNNKKSTDYGLLSDDDCTSFGSNLGGSLTQFVYQRPDNTDPKYIMSNSELDCYQKRYPDLSGFDYTKLQNQWTNEGASQNRDNQCPTVQTISGLYEYKGAFNEQLDRVIPDFKKKVSSVDECMSLAESNKQTVFGLQNDGDCWTGNNQSTIDKYGEVYDRTKIRALGSNMVNMTYVRKEAFPDPEPPVPKLSQPNFSDEIIESFTNNSIEKIRDEDISNFKYNDSVMQFSEKICGILLFIIIIIMIIICYVNYKK